MARQWVGQEHDAWHSGTLLRDPASGHFQAVAPGQAWVESVSAAVQWTPDVRLVEHVRLPIREPLEGLVLTHWISAALGTPTALNVRYDGGAWKRLELTPDRINVRPSGIRGAALWASRGASLLVSLSDAFVQRVAQESGVPRGPDGWLPLASFDTPATYATLRAMQAEARAGCPSGAVYGETMARVLLMQVWAAAGRRGPRVAAAPEARDNIDRALACLRERLAEPVTLAELAAVAGLTPFHFARAFKQRTGKPPHQYLLELRMRRACALLKDTNRPVAEVAAECGFGNASHFSRVFRRLVGTTPLLYRSR